MVHCIVQGCTNRSSRKSKRQEELEKQQTISFFSFPKNEIRRKIWCKAINITESSLTPNMTICSLHFQKEHLYGSAETRIRLKEDAIPFLDKSSSTSYKKQESRVNIYNNIKSIKENESCTTIFIDIDQIETGQDISTQSKLLINNETDIENMEEESNLISQSSSKVDKSTAVSPDRFYNSPQNMELRKELSRVKKNYQSQVKVLQQKIRRMKKKITNMKEIFARLKEKNFLQGEKMHNLKGIVARNINLLKRIIDKSKEKLLTCKFRPTLRILALTLYYYSPCVYSYARRTFDSCLSHQKTLYKCYYLVEPSINKETLAYIKEHVKQSNYILFGALI